MDIEEKIKYIEASIKYRNIVTKEEIFIDFVLWDLGFGKMIYNPQIKKYEVKYIL